MHRLFLLLPAVLVLAPGPGPAQSTDAIYCAKLAEVALRYLGRLQDGANKPDSDTVVAIDRCQKGDTASGIAILEPKLLKAGFTLPARGP
jgi:hypothetical protein